MRPSKKHDKLIQNAQHDYQSGRYAEAKHQLQKLLRKSSKNIDALNLLAITAYQMEDRSLALECIKKLLAYASDNVAIYPNVIKILQHYGEIDRAKMCLQQALQLNPLSIELLLLQAKIALQGEEYKEAIESYTNVLEINKDNIDALEGLNYIYFQQQRYNEVVEILRRLIQLRPDHAHDYNNLGLVYQRLEQYDQAEEALKKAISLDDQYAAAFYNLGLLYDKQSKREAAIAHLEKAIALLPEQHEYYLSLGLIYFHGGDHDRALDYLQQGLRIKPNDPACLYNLGVVAQADYDYPRAYTYYKAAIEQQPDYVSALNNAGAMAHLLGDYREAVDFFRCALAVDPQYANTHFNLSLALLTLSEWREGWREYEWRIEAMPEMRCREIPENVRWTGERDHVSLFIHAEQGIGDEIMFASSYASTLERVKKCMIYCDKRLLPIMRRTFPNAEFLDRELLSERPHPQDYQINSGSLLEILHPTVDGFSAQAAYLKPNLELVAKWRDRYAQLPGRKKIGIAWRGGNLPHVRKMRSTTLEQWLPILSMGDIDFINLQYGDVSREIESLDRQHAVTLHHWDDVDPLSELDDFFAQIAALDLVISIDNATVHMAGALGVPTWTLLPSVADWRWLLERDDTPWYACMRLIRQRRADDWAELFERVAGELKDIAM